MWESQVNNRQHSCVWLHSIVTSQRPQETGLLEGNDFSLPLGLSIKQILLLLFYFYYFAFEAECFSMLFSHFLSVERGLYRLKWKVSFLFHDYFLLAIFSKIKTIYISNSKKIDSQLHSTQMMLEFVGTDFVLRITRICQEYYLWNLDFLNSSNLESLSNNRNCWILL